MRSSVQCDEIYWNMMRIYIYICVALRLLRCCVFRVFKHEDWWSHVLQTCRHAMVGGPAQEDDESTRRFTTWNAWLGRKVGIGASHLRMCSFTPINGGSMWIWLSNDKFYFLIKATFYLIYICSMHLIEITLIPTTSEPDLSWRKATVRQVWARWFSGCEQNGNLDDSKTYNLHLKLFFGPPENHKNHGS